jgi:hypothetical protein
MLEQKGTNKKSHQVGAWRQIDHALVACANFAIWPRKTVGIYKVWAFNIQPCQVAVFA